MTALLKKKKKEKVDSVIHWCILSTLKSLVVETPVRNFTSMRMAALWKQKPGNYVKILITPFLATLPEMCI
jgi:hypothetical protein